MLDLPHSREYFASLFHACGVQPTMAFKTVQPDMLRAMVANGLGYSILNFPLQTSTTPDGREFVMRPFREKLRPMTLGVAYAKDATLRLSVRTLASFCEKTFRRQA
jgi:DNA-binding transcriptional LysR family regulator